MYLYVFFLTGPRVFVPKVYSSFFMYHNHSSNCDMMLRRYHHTACSFIAYSLLEVSYPERLMHYSKNVILLMV